MAFDIQKVTELVFVSGPFHGNVFIFTETFYSVTSRYPKGFSVLWLQTHFVVKYLAVFIYFTMYQSSVSLIRSQMQYCISIVVLWSNRSSLRK